MQESRFKKRGESMAYNLRITKHAEELLDRLVYYLLYRLKNEQAARHLLDSINDIYERLEENPLQFPRCRDNFLDQKGYHEVVVPQMNYVVVFFNSLIGIICGIIPTSCFIMALLYHNCILYKSN